MSYVSVLKACPFCGEKKKVMAILDTSDDSDDSENGLWQVYCFSCRAGGPMSAEEAVAIARWNLISRKESTK